MKRIKQFIALLAAAALPNVAALAESEMPKDYPLKKCPVSGEAYGEGGMKPYQVTHEGTDVWLCCKTCKREFDKEPAKYTKAVKDASAAK